MTPKKAIIIGIIFVVLAAAIATVLGVSQPSNNAGTGVAVPGARLGAPMPPSAVSVQSEKMLAAPAQDNFSAAETADKKIIKNGYLSLRVANADRAAADISGVAKANGGDVFSSDFSKNPQTGIKSGTVTIKVPFANFEQTFTQVKKVASLVIQESVSSQDITLQYSDLQAQLKNKQAAEQQYLQILKQAQKVSDILEVTQALAQVRGEIDQLQGQINYLNSQTNMASITANLTEDQNITVSDTWRPWQVVKDAVNSLISKLQGSVNFLIVLVITVIPVAIVYGLFAWLVYWIGKKIYFRLKNRNMQS